VEAVLFDLDGTLIDSAADLGAALNAVLIAENRRPLPLRQIRPQVSNGSHALIELGFGSCRGPEHEYRQQQLLQGYRHFPCRQTTLFAGIAAMLQYLEAHAVAWGIVTNKPGYLTESVLKILQLDTRAACVVSGDTVEYRKPHPQPLLYAASQLQVRPDHCIYIGDAKRDMEAGINAGMRTGVATYGYIPDEDDPEQWGAEWIFPTPVRLLQKLVDLVEGQSAS